MRAMRLHKRELHAPEIIKEILEECDVVRIGTQDEEGMFIIPVNYGYDFSVSGETMELALFIHGAGEGRKADAFAASPFVAVEMDCRHGLITGDYTCSYSYSYRSIMGCRTDFADIQNKKECGGNRQWQNHYLRNWAANTKGKGII